MKNNIDFVRLPAISFAAFFLFAALSCKPETQDPLPDPDPDPDPEVPTWTISLENDIPQIEGVDIYTVDAPAVSEADKEIAIAVTPAPGVDIRIAEVTANGAPCALREGGDAESLYVFTMPEEDVALHVSHVSAVRLAESNLWSGKIVEKKENGSFADRSHPYFLPGETVYLRFSCQDPWYKVSFVALGDGTEVEKCEDEEDIWSFEMPLLPVTVQASVGENFLAITEKYDDHCEVIVLDNFYGDVQDYEHHYHQTLVGNIVHYYTTVEIGYDAELAILGDRSGHNYFKDFGFVFQDDYTGTGAIMESFAFLMPGEPVTLELRSKERDIYAGEAFVGTYGNGLWINEQIDNHVMTTSTSMLSADIRGNGVFAVTSTDANRYDFTGTYTYDAAAKQFSYNAEDCKKYGLKGQFLSEDYLFATVYNILEDKPDNTHLYLISRKEVRFVRATGDQQDKRYFIEVDNDGKKDWWCVYKPMYAIYPVKADFSRGTSLGGVSTAVLTFDASPYAAKYTLDNAGGKPVIEYASSERGTYTGAGEDLILDGFGGAFYGKTAGTYVLAGVELTFTPNAGGDELVFYINQAAKTYETASGSGEWTGPLRYSTGFEGGRSNGQGGDPYVEVWLDHNFSGNEEKGKAKLVMRVGNNSLADNTVDYTYNASDNTIILSYWYVYYGSDWVEDDALTLKVSPDKQSLTFVQNYVSIYAAKGFTWILGGDQTVLVAEP